MKLGLLITLFMFLTGCGYKLMSKEDRMAVISQAMIVGYKLAQQDCVDTNAIKDFHLRDL